MRLLIYIIISFLIYSCSFDNQSGIWEDKKTDSVVKINMKNIGKIDNNISFEEYKKILIKFGEESDFPEMN
tara:strand:- start:124 stop:336 length:213 start_codon:yes stop_codon:yes gene_type:complete